jgi:triphosphatase
MHELELKFAVPPESAAHLKAALEQDLGSERRTHLQAHYFDTADHALAEAHLALRLRKEGERWTQTLKAEGDSRVHRLEDNVEVPAAADETPAIDPARHHGSDAGAALARALRHRHGQPLVARFQTDVWRSGREVEVDGGRVEIAFDEGRIVAGEASLPLCEIEFELKAGDAAALFQVARKWAAGPHRLWLSTISKAERGERLMHGQHGAEAVRAAVPAIDGGMMGEAVARAVVASCLDQILGNASEVASGRFDADHVHQLRIGIRRLRTAMRELRALSPAIDPAWETPLMAAFRDLGAYRDRQTVAGAVQPRLRAAGAPSVDWPEPAPGKVPPPERTVREPAFQAVLLHWLEFISTPARVPSASPDRKGRASHGPAGSDAIAHVRRRLRKLHRRIVADGSRFEALDEASQHKVRKRLKRLRYLAEFAGPLFDEQALERYLKRLRPAQDALGEHNDMHVAAANYRDAAERDPKAWFAVGWLQAQHLSSAKRCHRALERVADARKFWNG